MAASAFVIYGNAKFNIGKKLIDLSADTFAFVLATNSYVPNANTDALWSAVSANELAAGGGYTTGGVVLTSMTFVLSSGIVTWDGADPSWAALSAGPFRYGVFVRRAGGSLVAGDLLVCYTDLGGGVSISGTGGVFTVTLPSIFTMS